MTTSMAEKYDLYENVISERINGVLKQEFDNSFYLKKIMICDATKIYNQVRPHLSNLILTSQEMYKQEKLKRTQYKSKSSTMLA